MKLKQLQAVLDKVHANCGNLDVYLEPDDREIERPINTVLVTTDRIILSNQVPTSITLTPRSQARFAWTIEGGVVKVMIRPEEPQAEWIVA